jgi:Fur family ferric uptake transcriptional regulator
VRCWLFWEKSRPADVIPLFRTLDTSAPAWLAMTHDFSLGTVEVALAPRARFEEFLQSRGKRITQQRRILVDEVFKRHAHFDAEDLIAHLNTVAGARRVSRPTVYRTLSELVDSGLLRSMALGGRTVYEHDYGYPQHDHMHCQKCNKLIEFHSDEVAEIGEALAEQYQFRVTGHRLIFSGICADCRVQKRPTRKLDLV